MKEKKETNFDFEAEILKKTKPLAKKIDELQKHLCNNDMHNFSKIFPENLHCEYSYNESYDYYMDGDNKIYLFTDSCDFQQYDVIKHCQACNKLMGLKFGKDKKWEEIK